MRLNRASTGHQLIDRLNALHAEGAKLTQFQRMSLERDIEQLKSASQAEGLMVLGVYYAFSGESENALKHHRLSLNASGRDCVYLLNYGVTLSHLQFFSEAIKAYKEAQAKDPANAFLLQLLADACFYCGSYETFTACLALYLKASQDADIMNNSSVAAAISHGQDLARLGISEAQANQVYAKVEDVTKKHNVWISGGTSEVFDADGHKYLNVELRVNAPGSVLMEMNEELSDSISEDLQIDCWNKLIYSFVYSDKVEPQTRVL
ncbi:hypothetical protein [Stutzerimonas nitrititolerans]|uniref:hypothetical protein n=1 Tax=Stutzerimonas nitrititolerans TaxID=2482751 RepID=UPI003AA8A304